jgi:hypothetical protein
MWKWNSLLNDNLIREEIKKEIKDFLEYNENVDTSYPNLWDTMNAVLRVNLSFEYLQNRRERTLPA